MNLMDALLRAERIGLKVSAREKYIIGEFEKSKISDAHFEICVAEILLKYQTKLSDMIDSGTYDLKNSAELVLRLSAVRDKCLNSLERLGYFPLDQEERVKSDKFRWALARYVENPKNFELVRTVGNQEHSEDKRREAMTELRKKIAEQSTGEDDISNWAWADSAADVAFEGRPLYYIDSSRVN